MLDKASHRSVIRQVRVRGINGRVWKKSPNWWVESRDSRQQNVQRKKGQRYGPAEGPNQNNPHEAEQPARATGTGPVGRWRRRPGIYSHFGKWRWTWSGMLVDGVIFAVRLNQLAPGAVWQTRKWGLSVENNLLSKAVSAGRQWIRSTIDQFACDSWRALAKYLYHWFSVQCISSWVSKIYT